MQTTTYVAVEGPGWAIEKFGQAAAIAGAEVRELRVPLSLSGLPPHEFARAMAEGKSGHEEKLWSWRTPPDTFRPAENPLEGPLAGEVLEAHVAKHEAQISVALASVDRQVSVFACIDHSLEPGDSTPFPSLSASLIARLAALGAGFVQDAV